MFTVAEHDPLERHHPSFSLPDNPANRRGLWKEQSRLGALIREDLDWTISST
jgi:hypothetical protein